MASIIFGGHSSLKNKIFLLPLWIHYTHLYHSYLHYLQLFDLNYTGCSSTSLPSVKHCEMKKLLFFDQLHDARDIGFTFQQWELERVGSISEVLNHSFFCLRPENPDVFVVRVGAPGTETSIFLRYLKKYRPEIPFVLIINDDRHTEAWRTLLKGVDIELLKRTSVSGYLAHITDQLSSTF
jgi:hypothetical protein